MSTLSTIPTHGVQFTSQGFPEPIQGYDIHVYFFQSYPESVKTVRELHDDLKTAFPKLTVYDIVPRPVGPHATGMFQAYISTPEEFAVVVPWITLHRNGLSVLVHPHTGDHVADHAKHAIWIGEKMPVNVELLRVLQEGEMAGWVKK